jgi:hypothetical protein
MSTTNSSMPPYSRKLNEPDDADVCVTVLLAADGDALAVGVGDSEAALSGVAVCDSLMLGVADGRGVSLAAADSLVLDVIDGNGADPLIVGDGSADADVGDATGLADREAMLVAEPLGGTVGAADGGGTTAEACRVRQRLLQVIITTHKHKENTRNSSYRSVLRSQRRTCTQNRADSTC